ncbi:MAG TPA: penicillin-binding protein 2 [Bacteroidota bacterium]|mgnify:CR=1 FL=1|nr:penicillin-binding protein 2 [Bacteroidota bacterium]
MKKKDNSQLPYKNIKIWRIFGITILFSFLSILLVVRLFELQILDHKKYENLASDIQLTKIEKKANRGLIYDRNNGLLATNMKSLTVALDPKAIATIKDPDEIKKLKEFIRFINKITGIPATKINNILKSTESQYVVLAKALNIQYKDELKKNQVYGVIIEENVERIYPNNNLASHIIGFINSEGEGISGIELQYDTILRGRAGYLILKRDIHRQLHAGAELPNVDPIDGENIALTIDANLQGIVEYELMRGIELTQSDAGSVIIMDPNTGEVLAMASYPTFNPNISSERLPDFVRNRAITDEYEPGSIFKLVTASAALEEKIVFPEMKFSGMNGSYMVGGSVISDVHPLGIVTFRQATYQSSNVVYSQVAAKIPHNTFYKYIRDFGFGLLTDIELPGEARGHIPSPDEMNSILQRWVGFGYGISVTPLQMLRAYCAAANGGNLLKPYIIKSIFDDNGNIIYEGKPKIVRRVISKETSDVMKDLLTGVVEYGTGKSVRIKNLKIAGKTGTSQQLVGGRYSKSQYNASFVGFFPSDSPKIAMIVVLDSPKGVYYGGSTAAPIFKNITLRIISSSDILAKPATNGSTGTVSAP